MGNKEIKEKMKKSDEIDKSLILPNKINKKYLTKIFNIKDLDCLKYITSQADIKIIIDKKKLTIFNVDNEQKMYESDDFIQIIKNLSKLNIPEDIDFEIELIKVLKNRIFIIQTEGVHTYGTYFIFKFNEATNNIEIIEETKDRLIFFISQFNNGNFVYNSFIHRPIYTEDSLFYYDIRNNEKHLIDRYGEYNYVDFSDIAVLQNGLLLLILQALMNIISNNI